MKNIQFSISYFLFQENCETGLHLAILQEDGYSMYIVDFIIQNSIM